VTDVEHCCLCGACLDGWFVLFVRLLTGFLLVCLPVVGCLLYRSSLVCCTIPVLPRERCVACWPCTAGAQLYSRSGFVDPELLLDHLMPFMEHGPQVGLGWAGLGRGGVVHDGCGAVFNLFESQGKST
jgi:hypothetical protein